MVLIKPTTKLFTFTQRPKGHREKHFLFGESKIPGPGEVPRQGKGFLGATWHI